MPDKGKVERPYRYIREDFFLARSFRNLDDLNAQLRALARHGRQPAGARHHRAGRRRGLRRGAAAPPAAAAGAVPRRAQARAARLPRGHGQRRRQLYSVPDTTRRRVLEVQALADEIQIFEDGQLIAVHPVLEGRNQRRVAAGSSQGPGIGRRRHAGADEPIVIGRAGEVVARRSLDFYDAVALRLAGTEQPS